MLGSVWRRLGTETVTVLEAQDTFLPITDEQVAAAAGEVEGKTEMDALIAYLQELGTNRSLRR